MHIYWSQAVCVCVWVSTAKLLQGTLVQSLHITHTLFMKINFQQHVLKINMQMEMGDAAV